LAERSLTWRMTTTDLSCLSRLDVSTTSRWSRTSPSHSEPKRLTPSTRTSRFWQKTLLFPRDLKNQRLLLSSFTTRLSSHLTLAREATTRPLPSSLPTRRIPKSHSNAVCQSKARRIRLSSNLLTISSRDQLLPLLATCATLRPLSHPFSDAEQLRLSFFSNQDRF